MIGVFSLLKYCWENGAYRGVQFDEALLADTPTAFSSADSNASTASKPVDVLADKLRGALLLTRSHSRMGFSAQYRSRRNEADGENAEKVDEGE